MQPSPGLRAGGHAGFVPPLGIAEGQPVLMQPGQNPAVRPTAQEHHVAVQGQTAAPGGGLRAFISPQEVGPVRLLLPAQLNPLLPQRLGLHKVKVRPQPAGKGVCQGGGVVGERIGNEGQSHSCGASFPGKSELGPVDCSRPKGVSSWGDRSAYPRMAPRNRSMERKTYTLASITGSTMAFSQRAGSRCAARMEARSHCSAFCAEKTPSCDGAPSE